FRWTCCQRRTSTFTAHRLSAKTSEPKCVYPMSRGRSTPVVASLVRATLLHSKTHESDVSCPSSANACRDFRISTPTSHSRTSQSVTLTAIVRLATQWLCLVCGGSVIEFRE